MVNYSPSKFSTATMQTVEAPLMPELLAFLEGRYNKSNVMRMHIFMDCLVKICSDSMASLLQKGEWKAAILELDFTMGTLFLQDKDRIIMV
jgi:hypothetical protein